MRFGSKQPRLTAKATNSECQLCALQVVLVTFFFQRVLIHYKVTYVCVCMYVCMWLNVRESVACVALEMLIQPLNQSPTYIFIHLHPSPCFFFGFVVGTSDVATVGCLIDFFLTLFAIYF